VWEKVLHLMEFEKQRAWKVTRTRYNLERHISSDPLSSNRSYLLKFPVLPKIAPTTRKQAFNTQACGRR
jgi:hypothetical protein